MNPLAQEGFVCLGTLGEDAGLLENLMTQVEDRARAGVRPMVIGAIAMGALGLAMGGAALAVALRR